MPTEPQKRNLIPLDVVDGERHQVRHFLEGFFKSTNGEDSPAAKDLGRLEAKLGTSASIAHPAAEGNGPKLCCMRGAPKTVQPEAVGTPIPRSEERVYGNSSQNPFTKEKFLVELKVSEKASTAFVQFIFQNRALQREGTLEGNFLAHLTAEQPQIQARTA